MAFHSFNSEHSAFFNRAYIIDETPKPKDTKEEGGKVIGGDGEASEADPVEPKE